MANLILCNLSYIFLISLSAGTPFAISTKFITQTVYGFLDFTTTIGNTIMVFSPESAPTLDFTENKIEPVKIIKTKPIKDYGKTVDTAINPTKLLSVNSSESINPKLLPHSTKINSHTHSEIVFKQLPQQKAKDTKNTAAYIENNAYKPEYDLLSRQPTEYIEETFKLVDISPSSRTHNKARQLNSRICSNESESETLLDTGKIGTCATWKYALKNNKTKISPTATPRILKTAAPIKASEYREELASINSFSSHRLDLSKRFRHRTSGPTVEATASSQKFTEHSNNHGKQKKSSNRSKSKRQNKHSRNLENEKRASPTYFTGDGLRSFKPSTYTLPTETDISSSVHMFKLNRSPGRWQYKISPKPKINIRKPVSGNSVSIHNSTVSTSESWRRSNTNNTVPGSMLGSVNADLESSGSQDGTVVNNADSVENQKYLVETLNVEISTPPNFHDTYYEIATIKTPYIFQAGILRKTRYVTVTSTFQKSFESEISTTAKLEGPLTENILTKSFEVTKLDGSIITLSPTLLTGSEETPSLEVTTESYTYLQKNLKTKVLPVIRAAKNSTYYLTAIQTYEVRNLITVTKTILPHDTDKFIPSRNLKDFNINLDEAGSEINFDLEFGDESNLESERENKLNTELYSNNTMLNISAPSTNLNQQQLQQLALLNILKSLPQQPSVFTNDLNIKMQTIWQPHLSSASTIEPQNSVNPFILPAPQQFQTVTSPFVQQTLVTETNSKVLKLTFGAKTAYTTLFSTHILPKIITSFVTTSIPLQPTVAFPGYFPPPYPPFPYVG